MKVVFIHGLEGSPRGTKAQALAREFELTAEAMDTSDFEACIRQQAEVVARAEPDVVVGSSFGGAVAAALLQRGLMRRPTVLLAPAVRELGLPLQLPPEAFVLVAHGRADTLIHPEHSRELVASSARAELVWIDDDHRLQSLCAGGLAELVRRIEARAKAAGEAE